MNFRDILGSSNLRLLRLIELLYECRTGLSSDQLCEQLACSPPVLLKNIRMINSQKGAFRILKHKGLYQLEMKPNVSIHRLYAGAIQQTPEFQILEELLYEECENINDLSKKTFISTTKIQRDLKKIGNVLQKAGIKLQYRPLRLVGKESVIRHMYYRYFIERSDETDYLYRDLKGFQIDSIKEFVDHFIQDNQFDGRYISRKRLEYNIYISLWRIRNGHYYPRKELRSHFVLPEKELLNDFKLMASEVFRVNLTFQDIKDCLWLFYSDNMIGSMSQLLRALKEGEEYADCYYKHLELVEAFDRLLNFSLSDDEKQEMMIVLLNEHRIYDPDGKYINILLPQREKFLKKLSEGHFQALKKVKKIVEDFVKYYQIYQESDFVLNYVYILITMAPQSLTLLASYDRPIKILLLSEISPMVELFLGSQIENQVYGNFEVHYGGGKLTSADIDQLELAKYDALVTSSSVENIPAEYPTVVVTPFLSSEDIFQLQQLVSELTG